jgi:hypothetical protein
MPGKPITLRRSEYEVLSQAKRGYEQSQGQSVDWGRFLLFLLGLYILHEVTNPKERDNVKT